MGWFEDAFEWFKDSIANPFAFVPGTERYGDPQAGIEWLRKKAIEVTEEERTRFYASILVGTFVVGLVIVAILIAVRRRR